MIVGVAGAYATVAFREGIDLLQLAIGGEPGNFVELARAGQLINNATFQPFRVFVAVAVLYFIVCYPLSQLSRWLERRLHAGSNR